MFVGREDELSTLERLFARKTFQMAVIYGRRRVGKTALIDQFVKGKRTLYFTAQQKSRLQNLALFSQAVYEFFGMSSELPPFQTWTSALAYVSERAVQNPDSLVFVFDEFPYAAEADPTLPSVLQNAIDHGFKQSAMLMILCGSNEGFMESEVLGRKSPLYGRRTAQMKVRPFDYFDAARMLPKTAFPEVAKYYAVFGGTPYYVEQIDEDASFERNVTDQFFNISGLLYEEPLMLLRQELREPALYNSILDAVGRGATKPKEIAEKAGVERESVGKYLKTLEDLGVVRRWVPFGENPQTSRRGIYRLDDQLFAFWYRFVSANVGAIESGAGAAVAQAQAFGHAFDTFMGGCFETMCAQWLVRANRAGRLPFLASSFGRWWGTNPRAREEVDIDVLAANKEEGRLLAGECKWRSEFDETEALRTLEERSRLLKGYDEVGYALFSRNPASEGTKAKASERGNVLLVSAQDMYEPF